MKSERLLFFVLILLISCAKNPYDTSTPENYVLSMGLIGQQDKNDDPLPYFYDEISAKAIADFDALAEESFEEFEQFRISLSEKFPEHIEENEEGKIEVRLDSILDKNLRSFSLNVSLVGAQMKERSPSDYEFISATEPDSNNISQLTLIITGKELTLPITKTKDGYRMFLSEDVLETISDRIVQLEKMKAVFVEANVMLKEEHINEANLEEKIEELSLAYQKALK
ncbi:MAG: hypothetical protein KDC82_01865 [Bacteroidetes bacterium]|nr:hypothetical protein [Bacteroidota bacterium]